LAIFGMNLDNIIDIEVGKIENGQSELNNKTCPFFKAVI
jgi:hypothetical protein